MIQLNKYLGCFVFELVAFAHVGGDLEHKVEKLINYYIYLIKNDYLQGNNSQM